MQNSACIQLAKNVQRLRKEQGWSKVALAEMCGLHRNSVNDIEIGKGNPTLKVICLLAEQLRTSPEKLISPQVRKRVRPKMVVAKLNT